MLCIRLKRANAEDMCPNDTMGTHVKQLHEETFERQLMAAMNATFPEADIDWHECDYDRDTVDWDDEHDLTIYDKVTDLIRDIRQRVFEEWNMNEYTHEQYELALAADNSINHWFEDRFGHECQERFLTEFPDGCRDLDDWRGAMYNSVPIGSYWAPSDWEAILNQPSCPNVQFTSAVSSGDVYVLIPYDDGTGSGVYVITEDDFAVLRPYFTTGQNNRGEYWCNAFNLSAAYHEEGALQDGEFTSFPKGDDPPNPQAKTSG